MKRTCRACGAKAVARLRMDITYGEHVVEKRAMIAHLDEFLCDTHRSLAYAHPTMIKVTHDSPVA